MNKNYLYTDGKNIKNISYPQYPDDAWEFFEGAPDVDNQVLYGSVAAIYRAANLTADATSGLPFVVLRGEQEVDSSASWKNVVGWMPNPRDLIRRWRMSLFAYNAAYGFMETRKGSGKLLRYILPTSITPVVNPEDGLIGFKRKVGTVSTEYSLNDRRIFYIWRSDHTTELLPSKHTELGAALAAGNILYYSDYFIKAFFQRGGIKPSILMVEGVPSKEARESIEKTWTKIISGVYKYLGRIFDAKSMTVQTIGEGVDSIKDTTFDEAKIADIALACGMPLSIMLANSANFATARVERLAWYNNTIIPGAELMAGAMNNMLFMPLGLRLEFRPEMSEQGQEEEVQRAGAYQAYVASGMKPSVAAQVVGIDLPPGIEYSDLDNGITSGAPEQGDGLNVPKPSQEILPDIVKFIPTLDQLREMELWQTMAFRKLRKGNALDFPFEAKSIPLTIADEIRTGLASAKTEDDVKQVFEHCLETADCDQAMLELAEAINRLAEVTG